MSGLLSALGLGAAAPAVRRPVLEVAFGGGDWAESVVAVTVEAGLAPAVGAVEMVLAAGPDAPAPALDDTGTVKLGYDDAGPELVFTGRVDRVADDLRGARRVTVVDGAAALARLRVDQSFEQQTAGDVVGTLAGKAGASTGSVHDGVKFAFHVVDDRRSAWAHVAALARTSGLLAFVSPADELEFAAPSAGSPAASFAYGVDLLALEVRTAAPLVGEVSAVGEGAAGSQGADAWSWLLADAAPVTGTAGSGEPKHRLIDGALRSADAAGTAAKGVVAAAARLGVTGRAVVPGAPGVTVGSLVEIADAPVDALNGSFRVRALRHRYVRAGGFTTELELSGEGGGGALGALGGLL
jgi:phage protein D